MWHKGTIYLQKNWAPVLNQKLNCRESNHEEAASYNKHSVRIFKQDGTLLGHIPIELS